MKRALWIMIEAVAEATAIVATATARVARAQLLENAAHKPEEWGGASIARELTAADLDRHQNIARPRPARAEEGR